MRWTRPGEGEKVEGGQEGVVKAIEVNYEKDVMDEFLKPIIVVGDEGRIKGVSNISSFPSPLTVQQIMIPYSSSITGLTVCAKSSVFSVSPTRLWK